MARRDPEDIYMLPERLFRRGDETSDEEFYRSPRFVEHIDERATAAVTRLYRELLPEDGDILDLMSSWVSHLPEDVSYQRVAGLGMNEAELAANPRLDERVMRDLNQSPELPFADGEFDGAGLCVSVDYLIQPVEVLRETGRVLAEGAPLVVTFSNRCFPSKAVALWLDLDDTGRMRLVERYLQETGRFTEIQSLDRSPRHPFSDPLYAVVGRSAGPV